MSQISMLKSSNDCLDTNVSHLFLPFTFHLSLARIPQQHASIQLLKMMIILPQPPNTTQQRPQRTTYLW
jgi:hypothetical protein